MIRFFFCTNALFGVPFNKAKPLSHSKFKISKKEKKYSLPLYIYPPIWLDATLKPKHFESCHSSSQGAKQANVGVMVNAGATF